MKTRTVYRFGEFRLNPATHELLRGNDEVALPPKAFGCLAYLIENRDRAVGRDEMISAVWGRADCADSVVKRVIFDLRQALNDSGDTSQYVKSIRGVGYRWVAPVDEEVVEIPNGNGSPLWKHLLSRRWLVPAVVTATVILAFGSAWLWRAGDSDLPQPPAFVPAEGGIALLLPVDVEPGADGDYAWVRLGLMDMIAERLRAAGQAMVPSETVIALMQDVREDFKPHELGRLMAPTGARLILSGLAENQGGNWKVSLRSLSSTDEDTIVLSASAEAEDVLDAARMAADRIALSLGLTPAPEPDQEPGLALLLQQTEAAMLAQQMDVARELIESADAELRELPAVRLQLGWIEYNGGRTDAAEEIYESLLAGSAVTQNSELHARALSGLAGVYYQRGDFNAAKRVLDEAGFYIGADGALGAFAPRIQISRGLIALMLGDLNEAASHHARAYHLLEGTGNLLSMAALSSNDGLLEARRERYPEALFHFEKSARSSAALHYLAGELLSLANAALVHLIQLEPDMAAMLVESRFEELLDQVADPMVVAHAHRARGAVLDSIGERQEADRMLDSVLSSAETHGAALRSSQLGALMLLAERALLDGAYDEAARLAGEVMEKASSSPGWAEKHGRAWLILVRAQLGQGDVAAAADAAAAMADWSAEIPMPSPAIYAALAAAEVAAAENRNGIASAAYEQAIALADESRIPLRILRVAESYISWLLAREPSEVQGREHAVLVANRIVRYIDQHYDAALLWLRLHHATGDLSAWRAALERAQSLSGEREIPPELLIPPGRQQHQTTSLGTLP